MKMILFAMPGIPEMIMIGVIVILFFGGKKIPELMKGIGKGISEYKKARQGSDHE